MRFLARFLLFAGVFTVIFGIGGLVWVAIAEEGVGWQALTVVIVVALTTAVTAWTMKDDSDE